MYSKTFTQSPGRPSLEKFHEIILISFLPMVIFGYPIFALTRYLFDSDSAFFTYSYRSLILLASLILIKQNLIFKQVNLGIKILLVIVFAYEIRLLYDYFFVAHPEVLKPLIFYNLVTIPTILATVLSVGKIEKRLPIIYEVFKSCILVFTILLLIVFIINYAQNIYEVGYQRIVILYLNPISASQYTFAGLLLYVMFSTDNERSLLKIEIPFAAVVIICSYLAISFESRGPILCFFMVMLASLLLMPRSKKIILSMSYFLAVFLFFVLFIGDHLVQKLVTFPKLLCSVHESTFAKQFSMPNISTFDAAAIERIELYKDALTSISNNLLFGSSYLIDPRGNGYNTHNFFLEVGVALGISGLTLTVFLVILLVKKSYHLMLSNNQQYKPLICLTMFYLGCHMFSGAFWGSNILLVLITLIAAIPVNYEEKTPYKNE